MWLKSTVIWIISKGDYSQCGWALSDKWTAPRTNPDVSRARSNCAPDGNESHSWLCSLLPCPTNSTLTSPTSKTIPYSKSLSFKERISFFDNQIAKLMKLKCLICLGVYTHAHTHLLVPCVWRTPADIIALKKSQISKFSPDNQATIVFQLHRFTKEEMVTLKKDRLAQTGQWIRGTECGTLLATRLLMCSVPQTTPILEWVKTYSIWG